MDYSYLNRNVAEVRKKIESAENALVGGERVSMVAAVKYADIGEINYLCSELGVTDIGENRVQQLLEHYEGLENKNVNIHFIGTLQTNKVKYIVDKVCMIHSVDSYKLACEIDKQASKRGVCMDILLEINSGEEENKSGVLPADASAVAREISGLGGVRLRGFMTMAPRCENKADYIKFFSQTKQTALSIWRELDLDGEPLLSMGMSESFEEAIASGADIVRIGRSLFVK